jgi:hypothetical protein
MGERRHARHTEVMEAIWSVSRALGVRTSGRTCRMGRRDSDLQCNLGRMVGIGEWRAVPHVYAVFLGALRGVVGVRGYGQALR